MSPTFKARGKAKSEARQLRGHMKNVRRATRNLAAAKKANWTKLEKIFAKAKAHGAATKERLLEYVATRLGDNAELAQDALFALAKWAVSQVDPIAEVNRQLNEVEEKEAAEKAASIADPHPSVFVDPVKEGK